MKNIELSIKRGDRVWVKVYNERNGSFTSRMRRSYLYCKCMFPGQTYRM